MSPCKVHEGEEDIPSFPCSRPQQQRRGLRHLAPWAASCNTKYIWMVRYGQSTDRVATAAFWRTFHHDGKICWWGWGGARPPPFHATITYKVAVYAPAEWADAPPCFISTNICTYFVGTVIYVLSWCYPVGLLSWVPSRVSDPDPYPDQDPH